MSFLQRVSAFVDEHQLIDRDSTYIVALSGGADSVALLNVLCRLGIKIEAATCNFHLRGEESDRDEHFCVSLCRKLCVPIHRAHFDTLSYANSHGVSIEMAARDLRYGYFERLRGDIGARATCVAHHRDDCVETVLINLIRGTGIRGLRGIVPVNGNILRPLLCVGRKEIEDYLASIGQDYVTDSTNLVDDVLRNKIRLNVLPLLEALNPSVRSSIYETALHVTEAEKVFENAICKAAIDVMDGPSVDIAKLREQPSPESVLFHILRARNFSPSMSAQIFNSLDGETGSTWMSGTHEALLDRGRLELRPRKSRTDKEMTVSEVGTYVYSEERKFVFSLTARDSSFSIDRSRHCACLDAAKVCFPLKIRKVSNGDRFMPLGLNGSKLISDYLTDAKKSVYEKRDQLVVVDASGTIVWLVGERPDHRCRITSDTSSVLKILLRA